jgi:hypothetical protein
MDYDLAFGKAHAKKRKAKLNKKMLDSMSLKKLKTLAKKHKVSCYKKGTKVCVKKSTLLKRLKKSRSINKILESASKMKKGKTTKKTKTHRRKVTKVRKSRFGMKNQLPANFPNFQTPLELSLGQTYPEQLRHYKSIPSTLISANFQGPANRATGFPGKGSKPHNFKFTQGSLGSSSLPSFLNINDPRWSKTYPHKFGRYFH